ncbi:hypothetical protein HFO55_01430 [Rhizobium leguminosarum]|nr:hypothetical protein [Rhizobium leguminosarum]MBY5573097.1 hypothetical protein [Rhizobium leguminosarum]
MQQLIKQRTKTWSPSMVTDPIQESLLMIIAGRKKALTPRRKSKGATGGTKEPSSNVINIMDAYAKAWKPNSGGRNRPSAELRALQTSGPMIGFVQTPGSVEPDQGWHWIDGEEVTYINWGRGSPGNSDGNQSLAQFRSNTSSPEPIWDDIGNCQDSVIIEVPIKG